MTSPAFSNAPISSTLMKHSHLNPLTADVSPDSVALTEDNDYLCTSGSGLDRRVIQDLRPPSPSSATQRGLSSTAVVSVNNDNGSFLTAEYFDEIQSVLDTMDGDDFFKQCSAPAANNQHKETRLSKSSNFKKEHANQQIYEQIVAEAVGYFNRKDTDGLLNVLYDKYCSNDVLTVIHRWRQSDEASGSTSSTRKRELQEQQVVMMSKRSRMNSNNHQIFSFESNQKSELVSLVDSMFARIPDAVMCPTTSVNVTDDLQSGTHCVMVKMSITGSVTHNVSLSKLNTLLPDIGQQLLVQYERLLVHEAPQNNSSNNNDTSNQIQRMIPKLTPPQMMNVPISISTRMHFDGYFLFHFDEETNRIVNIEIHYFA